ncbi:MAG: hypothetical protein ACI9TH_002291 [Kiritimatiellia bacterium]|jgi:hypothetical protein
MKSILPLAVIFGLFTHVLFAEEAVSLSLKWQQGKTYNMSTVTKSNTKMSMGGQDIEQGNAITQDMTMVVGKPNDQGHLDVTTTFDRMAMKMSMGGQVAMDVDSDKPETLAGPMAEVTQMVGKSFTFVVDKDSKIVEYKDMKALLGDNANNPILASMLDEKKLKEMTAQGMLQALPEKPVKPGDSWPFKIELPIPQVGTMAVDGTYTFDRMDTYEDHPCAVITLTAAIKADFSGLDEVNPQAKALGLKIEKGQMSGTYYHDNALGMARQTIIRQHFDMTMKNPVDGTVMHVPVDQNTTTTIKKVEDTK